MQACICNLHTHSTTPGFFSWAGRVLLLVASSAAVPDWFPELGIYCFPVVGSLHGLVPGAVAPELIVQATEAKAKAESLATERAKDLQLLQEENNRLRNEIKLHQEYKEKAHRELCRVRDEQKTIGKIKVNTEL